MASTGLFWKYFSVSASPRTDTDYQWRPFCLRLFLNYKTILQQSSGLLRGISVRFTLFLVLDQSYRNYIQFDLCRLLLGNSAIYFESAAQYYHVACLYVNRSLVPLSLSALTMLPTSPTNFPAILALALPRGYLTEIPTKILFFCTEKHLIILTRWSTDNGRVRAETSEVKAF